MVRCLIFCIFSKKLEKLKPPLPPFSVVPESLKHLNDFARFVAFHGALSDNGTKNSKILKIDF